MARESRTPFVVLGILGIADPRPISGYDVKQIIDGTISHFWAESYGQIYPVLKNLAAEKLIRRRPGSGGGRKRVVYSITPAGKKRLAIWLQKPPEEGPHRDELILKLFFGSMTDIPVLVRHLRERRDRLKGALEQYSGWLKKLESNREGNAPFQLITLRGGIAMCEAFVKWADESLATLNRMSHTARRGKNA
jgi:PadR family transcriptional regulator, regulatory protein AphA